MVLSCRKYVYLRIDLIGFLIQKQNGKKAIKSFQAIQKYTPLDQDGSQLVGMLDRYIFLLSQD